MNCNAVSVEAAAAAGCTLHCVVKRSAVGLQLSAVQTSGLKERKGELQFKVHDVGRPGPLPRYEYIIAVSRKLVAAEQKHAKRRKGVSTI